MPRLIIASLALAALAAGTAQAQQRPSMDCDRMMEQAAQRLASMKASGGKRAALARMAARGYDYCMAGDTFNAAKFFEMLNDR